MREGDKLEAWVDPGLDIPGTWPLLSWSERNVKVRTWGVFQPLCLRVQWSRKTVYNPYT